MPARTAVFALAAWTLFLWISRLRNVLVDDDLTSAGRAWRVGVVVVFVFLALWVAFSWRSRAERPQRLRLALQVLVNWTIVFWMVRGVGILLDDHDVGFTVIHTLLMLVSIGVALWAWPRQVR